MEDKKHLNLPAREAEILEFWEKNKIFEKSLKNTAGGKPFVFYEGPPTANGLPHIGHALTRAFKDIILRYKTMRGFYVPRKAGWDTHGLPVEVEVEKALGLKTKQDIEKYGIGRFNQKAKESVWHYKDEWEKFTNRLGFWLDLKNPYITYDTSYIETLWRIIKEIWKKGLLYQDFKVIPWCPRCQTGLSSHEVGQGYKTVKDRAVYVKFKLKKGQKIKNFAADQKTYILAWTTTPWTLPGNAALAVGNSIKYLVVSIKGTNDKFILANDLVEKILNTEYSIHDTVIGKDLAGLEYEPLFDVPELKSEKSYQVYEADFVSTEEGTGVVHTAVMYGEDDYKLGKKNGLPAFHTVTENGRFISSLGENLGGRIVKDPQTEELIISLLKKQNLLFKEENYEHEYPFCWRCDTPLLYYARNAWWIKTTAVKKELLANNNKINWIPEHLKKGRFGEFLQELRDWAFSRERYWGTPLPVWQCKKCSNQEVIGSREELANRRGKPKNRYFIMRHGEALSNVKNIISYAPDGRYPETLKGKIQAEQAAKKLKNYKIDFIVSSDILRTKETAKIMAKVLGIKKIITDRRLREINTGNFEGKNVEEYNRYYSSMHEKFLKRPPGKSGESLSDLRRRVLGFLEDTEKKYSNKTLLIISHEYPLWMLYGGALGLTNQESMDLYKDRQKGGFIHFAEVLEMNYRLLPKDETGEVNLHRPYVDDFEFSCQKCGGDMKRIPEVTDVWFDSGSMPFASQTDAESILFPADYICEAVDQTRGWFYSLLAVATLIDKDAPYKNVISLGHVLDKNWQKMSKSKGNVVDPGTMLEKYGADALRWYFYTVNAPGEAKRFDEKDLAGKLHGFIGTFWNSFVFFDIYVDKITNYKLQITNKFQIKKSKSQNVLDRWILAKLNSLLREAADKLDRYDIMSAARRIEDFVINDFSQWYLRRSRRRFQQPRTQKEKDEAALVSAEILLTLSKLIAPLAPFLSEAIYQKLRKKLDLKEMSVHLVPWPPRTELSFGGEKLSSVRTKILKDMETIREIVTEALKLRAEAGIKVRQPLRELRIKNQELRIKKELLNLIKEEVNVKEITFGKELKLDTAITPELKEEGIIREVIRNIQEMRRDAGFKPQNKIRAQFSAGKETVELFEKWKEKIKTEANAVEITIGGKKRFKIERELNLENNPIWIGIR